MIKASAKEDKTGKPVYFFGITDGNIELLRQKRPMLIDLADVGGIGKIIISWGPDEMAIFKEMRDAGLLPPDDLTPGGN